MGRPKPATALVRAARQAGTFTRVEVPKVTCDRCGSTVYASPDGSPRPHLRATRPGEPLHSEIVPVMADCAE